MRKTGLRLVAGKLSFSFLSRFLEERLPSVEREQQRISARLITPGEGSPAEQGIARGGTMLAP